MNTQNKDWGSPPRPQEFIALGRKMKSWDANRSGRPALDRTSPSFLCPAQALGLALQRHPILLAGEYIITRASTLTHHVIGMRQSSTCKSIVKHTMNFLMPLNYCPTTGDHLK